MGGKPAPPGSWPGCCGKRALRRAAGQRDPSTRHSVALGFSTNAAELCSGLHVCRLDCGCPDSPRRRRHG